ncbi:heterokaryon incompatibility protein (HET) domain-containing protein [Pochonia chlamydosporia 170]|uniref:Heterokaryon incompatibility protein (HET) domain-containing protein n=1 Tax=Pochonia chlamydosporia 170 TaxID=1380566 RepID=A0A219AQ24_METCM|nr:heterokaryon incompatibility protein (HET) domain-containing protein [Pochonia chlamydosporia 170]OWT42811.1 heterokaryon incompatibility protein (HET) domain-containing protein [Pochonia chlamydosporia 170]
MSTVIRDAMAVCKALDIRFLWIDSVCIVQDDKSDWEVQSQQMGSVYRYSFLTICAPTSHSCDQGFLGSNNHAIDVPFRSRINPGIVGSYTIEDQGQESGMRFLHPNNRTPYNIDTGVSSWATRGWVFQERKLSPRKLVFGRSMFHFVCAHHSISQNGLVLPSPMMETLLPVFRALQLGLFNEGDVHMAWTEIASEYADLTLQQQHDRLPAISGLAQLFADSARLSEDSYVAGHWKAHLLKGYGLLWQRESIHTRQSLLDQFRAAQRLKTPTWSWANQARSFKPGYLHYHPHGSPARPHSCVEFQKMDVETSHAGLNAFGSVTSGMIRMTGRLKAYASLRVSRQYPSTYARRLFEGDCHIADCVLDWVVHHDGEEQDGLILLPLLSACPGESPGLLIYDELRGYDIPSQRAKGRCVVPSSNAYTFSATMNATILKRMTSPENQEDAEPKCQCFKTCAHAEKVNRDVFGIVLCRSDVPEQYWRVGVFFSEASETAGLALFRDVAYQEIITT